MDLPEPSNLVGYRFSPFNFDYSRSKLTRLGVPSGKPYEYTSNVNFHCTHWHGSVLQLLSTNRGFFAQVSVFLMMVLFAVFAKGDWSLAIKQTAKLPTNELSIMTGLVVFAPVFFISQVFAKWNIQIGNVAATNGAFRGLVARVAGCDFPKVEAETVIRYANALMHITYFKLVGPMKHEQWTLLIDRHILRKFEVTKLCRRGSYCNVIMSWMVKQIHKHKGAVGHPHTASMEAAVGKLGCLAEKQYLWTKTQIPFVYFSAVHWLVHIIVFFSSIISASHIGLAAHYDCHTLSLLELPIRNEAIGFAAPEDLHSGRCTRRIVFLIVTHSTTMAIFMVFALVANKLADPFSDKGYSYDLGFDLDKLWQESKDVVASMDDQDETEESFAMQRAGEASV
jgi:hypothetical protein